MPRPVGPAWRAARLFHVGDEIRLLGDSDWSRIVEIHNLPGQRRLILEPAREFYAEPSFQIEHRRIPEES